MVSFRLRFGAITIGVIHPMKKPDGSLFYKRRVPKDLRQHYPGKEMVVVSLQKRDPAVAARKVARMAAEDDAKWRTLRSPEGKHLDLTTYEAEAAARALLRDLSLEPGEALRTPDKLHDLADHFQFRYDDAWYRGDPEEREGLLNVVEREALRLVKENPTKRRVTLKAARDLYLRHAKNGSKGMPRHKVIDISTNVTLEDLKTIERTQPKNSGKPLTLMADEIGVAGNAFQWRFKGQQALTSTEHTKTLMQALGDLGDPLERIDVAAIGSHFYVVDGHHRLQAYRSVRWAKPVPVEVHDWSVDQAWEEALKRNSRDKLPMNRQDKYEAAWSLVKSGSSTHSIKIIAGLSTVSKGTVSNMRKRHKALVAAGHDLAQATWAQALRSARETEDWDAEALKDTASDEWAETLAKAFGKEPMLKPEIFVLAISKLNERLPRAMMPFWHEAAHEYVEEVEGEFGELDL